MMRRLHGSLGTENDHALVAATGVKRDVNRSPVKPETVFRDPCAAPGRPSVDAPGREIDGEVIGAAIRNDEAEMLVAESRQPGESISAPQQPSGFEIDDLSAADGHNLEVGAAWAIYDPYPSDAKASIGRELTAKLLSGRRIAENLVERRAYLPLDLRMKAPDQVRHFGGKPNPT